MTEFLARPPDPGLDISVADRDDAITVITLAGELDVYTAPELRDVLRQRGYPAWGIFDLEAVTFIDMTGIGLLVGALKRARAAGGSVAVACSAEPQLKALRVSGLLKVLSVTGTVGDAAALLEEQKRSA